MINISKVKKAHSAFLKNHDKMVADVTNPEKLEQFAQRWIGDNSGLTMRTGNLRDSTKVTTIRTRSGALVKVANKAKYAAAQDLGSGIYGPKRSRYRINGNPLLRFQWKGQIVYRRYVMHPGVKASRFLYNATDATARTVKAWMLTRMNDVARKF